MKEKQAELRTPGQEEELRNVGGRGQAIQTTQKEEKIHSLPDPKRYSDREENSPPQMTPQTGVQLVFVLGDKDAPQGFAKGQDERLPSL